MEPTTEPTTGFASGISVASDPQPQSGLPSAADRLEGLANRADLALDRLVAALQPVVRPMDVPGLGRVFEDRQVSPLARHLHDQADRFEQTLDRLDNVVVSLDI